MYGNVFDSQLPIYAYCYGRHSGMRQVSADCLLSRMCTKSRRRVSEIRKTRKRLSHTSIFFKINDISLVHNFEGSLVLIPVKAL